MTPEEKRAAAKQAEGIVNRALTVYETNAAYVAPPKRERPLKVYGIATYLHGVNGQKRAIVAATSKAAAAKAMGLTAYFFNGYGAETFNDQERRVALAEPGITFYQPLDAYYRSDEDWEALR